MVTCQLTGGFGNQLCQVAAVIAYALEHNMPFCIPTETADPAIWPKVYFHWMADPYGQPFKIDNTFWDRPCPNRDWLWHQEPDNQEYKEIPAYPYVQLRGHFQSYKYWQKHIRTIQAFLRLYVPGYWNKTDNQEGTCAVHVRRGDYMQFPVKHPVVTNKYLVDAIRYAYQQGIKKFVLFSDDMQWCRSILDGMFRRSMELLNVEIFYKMMGCQHHIISNSSYSLMAAHLRQNPSGVIIAPAIWTLEPKQIWNTDHIIPPNWIRI
jgi:hypothetical protein